MTEKRMYIHIQHYVLEGFSSLCRHHTHFSVQSTKRLNICHGITNRPNANSTGTGFGH